MLGTPPRAVRFLLLFTALAGLFAIASKKEISLNRGLSFCPVCTAQSTAWPQPTAEPAGAAVMWVNQNQIWLLPFPGSRVQQWLLLPCCLYCLHPVVFIPFIAQGQSGAAQLESPVITEVTDSASALFLCDDHHCCKFNSHCSYDILAKTFW